MRVSVEIGKRYGKWLVEANAERRRNEQYFVCVCACGSRSEIRKSILVKGESGCAHCRPKRNNTTHGMTHSFEFSVWTAMKKRCQYTKHPHYRLYGGRGISVCESWQSFENFLRDMGLCPYANEGSIDRIDPNGNYAPDNCRWVLRSAQAKHRRNVPLIDGLTLPELASRLGIRYTTLRRRISAGWDRTKWGMTPQELGTRK